MKWKAYPEYKDSATVWLGKITKHWRLVRFSHYIDYQEGPGILAEDFMESGVPLLRIENIRESKVRLEGCNYLSEKKVAQKWEHFRLKENDILISCSASTGMVSEVSIDSIGSIAYTGIIRLRPSGENIKREYIRWLVSSDLFFIQIDLLKTGSTIQHFGPIHLQQMKVTLPPLPEQDAIVRHLNTGTERIDTLIAKKERQIELLQEKRSALISQAVTKGLNPNAKMKDSGIEWLGEIPEHWTVKRIKYASLLLNGYAFESNSYVDIGLPIIRIGDVGEIIDWHEIKRVPPDLLDKLSRFRVLKGDVLIALTGATIGKSSVFESDEIALLNQRVGIIRGIHIEQGFLKYIVCSNCFKKPIDFLCYGGAQDNIGKEELGNISIGLPPLSEQRATATFLDQETERIGALISKVRDSIEKLREYRTALISAAVTGKIDVRKEVA